MFKLFQLFIVIYAQINRAINVIYWVIVSLADFSRGKLSNCTLQRRWTKLHYIWKNKSSIITAINRKLWYRLVASFANEGGSKKSGVENGGQSSHFLTPCKN